MTLNFIPRDRVTQGEGFQQGWAQGSSRRESVPGVHPQHDFPPFRYRGDGQWGQMEYHVSRFFQELTNPSMVLGMALGVSAFNVTRSAALPSLLRSSSRFLRQIPFAARFAASSIALVPEVGAFWGTSKVLNNWIRPGSNVWDLKGNSREILGLGMTLGFLKSFGFVFGQWGAILPLPPMFWQQAGMLSGIMAGHGAEILLGWNPPSNLSSFLTESLLTLGHFNMGGALSQRMFPGIFRLNARIQAGMAAREQAQRQALHPAFPWGKRGAAQIFLKKYFSNLNPGIATPEGFVMMEGDQGGEGPKGGGGAVTERKKPMEGTPLKTGIRKVLTQGGGGPGSPFKDFISFLIPEKLGDDFCQQLSRLARGEGAPIREAAIPQRVVEMRAYINTKAPENFREPLLFLLAQNLVMMGRFAEVDAILREESFAPPPEDQGEFLRMFSSFEDSVRLALIQGLVERRLWQGEINPLDHLSKVKTPRNRLIAWQAVLDGLARDELVPQAFQLLGGKRGEGAAIKLNPQERANIQEIFQEILESHGYLPIHGKIPIHHRDFISMMERMAEVKGIRLQFFDEPALVFPARGMGLIREWNLLPKGFELISVHTWVNEEGRVAMRPKMPSELSRFGVLPQQWTGPALVLSLEEALKLQLIRMSPAGNAYLEAAPPELMVYYPQDGKDSFPPDN